MAFIPPADIPAIYAPQPPDSSFAQSTPPFILPKSVMPTYQLRYVPAPDGMNPLGLTWQEQASTLARIGINRKNGEHLGMPSKDADGSYTYPILDKNEKVIGGMGLRRDEEGVLRGGFGLDKSGGSADHGVIAPGGNTGFTGGKGDQAGGARENTGEGWNDATGFGKPSVETGYKAEASASVLEARSGFFSMDSNGNGWSHTFDAAGLKGSAAAKAALKAGLEKNPQANLELEAGADGRLISGGYEIQKFGSVRPGSEDQTCDQFTATGKFDAFVGAAAKASGHAGTDGLGGKLTVAAGPGVSLSGDVNLGKDIECKVENRVIGADDPFASSPAEPGLLQQYAEKFREDLSNAGTTNTSELLAAARSNPATEPVPDIPLADRVVPTYGNYCGPSWYGGRYNNDNMCRIDWTPPPPVDEMDQACKEHDEDYIRGGLNAQTPNTNPDKQEADLELLEKINNIPNSELGVYGDIYKTGVQEVFGYKTDSQGVADSVTDFLGDMYDGAKQIGSNIVDSVSNFIFGTDEKPAVLDDLAEGGASALQSFSSSSGGGQSITEVESQADDLSDQCDSHADRAESAARRARSAARRAAAAAARMRAMLSRRR